MQQVSPDLDRGDWLSPYVSEIDLRRGRVLELGSGHGEDAGILVAGGANLVASDRQAERAREVARRAPSANVIRMSHAHRLPFQDGSFAAVVASLALHYMDWETTLSAFAEVRRVLLPDGDFLFRVNASDDFEFGAGRGRELEPGFFKVSGRPHDAKRFFDKGMVQDCLTDGFQVVSLRPRTLSFGGRNKRTWECFAKANG